MSELHGAIDNARRELRRHKRLAAHDKVRIDDALTAALNALGSSVYGPELLEEDEGSGAKHDHHDHDDGSEHKTRRASRKRS